MVEIDLHVHTTASDGTLTPSQVVHLAKKRRLKAIAITDHDTVDGVQEAQEEGQRVSLEIIPGIEISANIKTGSVHLLGYFVQTKGGILREKLEKLKEARSERNPKIVDKLNDLGIDITYQEVVAASGGGQVGRPHFAQVLVDKGYVASLNDAFDRYLAQGAPAYVNKFRLDVRDAIDMVLKAQGIPVLAHPFTLNYMPRDLENLVVELTKEGLKGIEAFYPDHTREQTAQYRQLAEKVGLLKTGGSDFHGNLMEKAELGIVGNGVCLPYTLAEELMRVKQEMVYHL
ncbi:MAG: PHP domain-containing protein [Proteobacteria bacterium]|nr:PHP domain-containing protein [Pseudomonadota bacterium]